MQWVPVCQQLSFGRALDTLCHQLIQQHEDLALLFSCVDWSAGLLLPAFLLPSACKGQGMQVGQRQPHWFSDISG